MLTRLVAALLASIAAVPPAAANDGFGGLTAGGLQFADTEAVQMLSEELFLGLDTITVDYVFRPVGDRDVTGMVIFPLPPIALAGLNQSDFALSRDELDRENFVDFTAKVDGRTIPVTTDRVALLVPDGADERPPSARYESPGDDVTALLQHFDIPLSLDVDKVVAVLDGLPQAAKDELAARHLAEFEGGGGLPLWSISERYSWSQTFVHGRELRISHRYRAAPPGGIFVWRAADAVGSDLARRYCIDKGTAKAIAKALPRSAEGGDATYQGTAYYLDYVLTTAKSWAGPIGRFKLTIDKDQAVNVLSLCLDGLKKTGPTRFTLEKRDYTPQRDLRLLIIVPNEEE